MIIILCTKKLSKYAELSYLVRFSVLHFKEVAIWNRKSKQKHLYRVSRIQSHRIHVQSASRILYELCQKPSYRFGELKKAIPKITNTMLTATLRDLEELGIVTREQFNEIPPHVEYSLTDKGRALFPIFVEMAKWGEAYL